MLNIVANHHCMQFQGKIMIQTQENGRKPHFGPDLSDLCQIYLFCFLLHAKIIMNHRSTVFGIAIVSLNIFTFCHT